MGIGFPGRGNPRKTLLSLISIRGKWYKVFYTRGVKVLCAGSFLEQVLGYWVHIMKKKCSSEIRLINTTLMKFGLRTYEMPFRVSDGNFVK